MAPIRITTLLLTLTTYCLQRTAGAPSISAPTATMGSFTAESDYTCSPLLHDYCKSFATSGGRTVGLPNPRQGNNPDLLREGETYYSNAVKEFTEFSLLLNTQCSDKLGTLLCFFYFPFCDGDRTTRPCLSLCEEVTNANSTCTKELAKYGISWGAQFDCANYMYNGEHVFVEENCANEAQMPWPYVPSPSPVPTPETTSDKIEASTATTTTATTKASTTDKMEASTTATTTTAKTEEASTTVKTEEEITTTTVAQAPVCSPCNGKEIVIIPFQRILIYFTDLFSFQIPKQQHAQENAIPELV